MKKHILFFTLALISFFLVFLSPMLIGMFSADNTLTWSAFKLFSIISVVSFFIGIVFLITEKTK